MFEVQDHFVDALPGDPSEVNISRAVPGAAYSRVRPTPVSAPRVIAYSPEVAALLGLEPGWLESEEAGQVLSGNALLEATPYAMCYGGHQFGNWAGQLGDGRAINLGERVHDEQRYTLQLKGAGPTPYSRGSDGRAVLRSSIREFLCSEAMHHLGIPTTRALSLVQTGDTVVRDMFYDGNPKPEPGAIVCRVSPSFLRFGSYEIFTARRDIESLKTLVDFTIREHFPELGEGPDAYLAWFKEVVRRTANLIVDWMRVGFVHGVMNTDNLSILGLTIDYGPYGWLDDYDPSWTPNTTDFRTRRYCYGNQPRVGYWNLMQLANAIAPLFEDVKGLQAALDEYPALMDGGHTRMMAAKLGLADADLSLMESLMEALAAAETDWTLFFRLLARAGDDWEDTLRPAFYAGEAHAEIKAWMPRYLACERDTSAMDAVNPKYVLRNYLAQEAIDLAEAGDPSRIHELLEVMRQPYAERPEFERYAARRPDWARDKPGCSTLSCSS